MMRTKLFFVVANLIGATIYYADKILVEIKGSLLMWADFARKRARKDN